MLVDDVNIRCFIVRQLGQHVALGDDEFGKWTFPAKTGSLILSVPRVPEQAHLQIRGFQKMHRSSFVRVSAEYFRLLSMKGALTSLIVTQGEE